MSKWFLPVLFIVSACGSHEGSPNGAQNLPSTPFVAGADLPVQMSSPWGQALNQEKRAPKIGFRAFYFDRRNPRALIYREDVESIAIKYAWSDFHKIASPNFGAYWVGRARFDQPTNVSISVSQSWAKSRIFIDGKIVFEGGGSQKINHAFNAGEHVIEVEYANSWHTTEFKVTLQDIGSTRQMSADEAFALLRSRDLGHAQVSYVGVYESASTDTKIIVRTHKSSAPAVLWLNSYEAIDWRVVPTSDVKLTIVSSYAPGSRVQGIPADKVVYLDKDSRLPSIHSLDRNCGCHAGLFHCEQTSDLTDLDSVLRALSGLSLGGYALAYSPTDLEVQPWNETRIQVAQLRRRAEAAAQRACVSEANPDFDELMQKRR